VTLAAGRTNIMGRTTEQVAVHKERHLVPLSLNVSKLSGVGEDTLFIGIMEVRSLAMCHLCHSHDVAQAPPPTCSCSPLLLCSDPVLCSKWSLSPTPPLCGCSRTAPSSVLGLCSRTGLPTPQRYGIATPQDVCVGSPPVAHQAGYIYQSL
jgi:hypothetical protein